MPRASTKVGQKVAQSPTRWPPVPDMFDVVSYFLARGDSYTLIASVGFWTEENPRKALSSRALKRWYETERDRRAAAERVKPPVKGAGG